MQGRIDQDRGLTPAERVPSLARFFDDGGGGLCRGGWQLGTNEQMGMRPPKYWRIR